MQKPSEARHRYPESPPTHAKQRGANAIHPFREGNGRTQLTYLTLLAARAGHPLALARMEPAAMLAAMVASFKSDETPLAALIGGLIE